MCYIFLLFVAFILTHAKIKNKIYGFSLVFLQSSYGEKDVLKKLLYYFQFFSWDYVLRWGFPLKYDFFLRNLFKKFLKSTFVLQDISHY